MNFWDIRILTLVAVLLVLAFRSARGRTRGSCCGNGGCSCGCGMNCQGACPACEKRAAQEKTVQ